MPIDSCCLWGVEIVRSRRAFYRLDLYDEDFEAERIRYLNIGAGSFSHPRWHNLDVKNEYYGPSKNNPAHIEYDLTSLDPFPIESSSVKVAYCSHVVEHLTDTSVNHMFEEVFRILEPGGIFRVTCPDMRIEVDALLRGDEHFWEEPGAYGLWHREIEYRFLDHLATALAPGHPYLPSENAVLSTKEIVSLVSNGHYETGLQQIVKMIPKETIGRFPADHVNWFTTEKVKNMTGKLFKEVYESRYLQSRCPVLRNPHFFDNTAPWLSLYIECIK